MNRDELLQLVYQTALDMGLSEDGARVAVAIALTEGAFDGEIGDQGNSFGIFQFHKRGMLPGFASALGVSVDQAGQIARRQPEQAIRWALSDYLGNAIRRGQEQGIRGAELATYAQRTGQRSKTPERAGQNYSRVPNFGTAATATTESGAVFPVAGKSAADIRYGYGDADYKRQTGDDHKGVDVYVPIGTQVVAPVSGRVVSAGYDGKNLGVVIEGPDGKHYSVWHLSKAQVKAGQQVQVGQPIALSGDTDANAPHVHFQIRAKGGGAHEDPSAFLASTGGGGKIGRARPMMAGSADSHAPGTALGDPSSAPTIEQETTGVDWLDKIIERRGSPIQVIDGIGEPFIEETEEVAEGGRDDTGAPITGKTKRTVRKPNPVNTQRLVWADGTYIDVAYETGQPARIVKTGTDKALASPEPASGEPGAKENTGPPAERTLPDKTVQEWDEKKRAWVTVWSPPVAGEEPEKVAAPVIRLFPDKSLRERDPATGEWTVIGEAPLEGQDDTVTALQREGYEIREINGSVIAINPDDPSDIQIVYDGGQTPPNYRYEVDPATGQLMAIDPATASAIPVEGMGAALPPEMQLIQNHLDTIAQIEGMLEREEITFEDAERYIAQANQYAQAAQYGATPFQQEQERRITRQNEQQMGESLINQRLSTGASLANGLISSAFNLASTTMMPEGMDSIGYNPAMLALMLTQELGGGPEVAAFAKQLLMGSGATPEAQAAGMPIGAAATPGTITPEQYASYASRSGTQPPAGMGSLLSVQPSTSPVGEQMMKAAGSVPPAPGAPPPGSVPPASTQRGVITPEQFAEYQRRLRQRTAA